MNSFCDTVFVIVMLLRRREAGERGEMKARGHDGKGEKRKRGPCLTSHRPLGAYFFFIIIVFFI